MTEVIKADDPRSPEKAASILKRGGIIIYPTETLYGIGALASRKEAVTRVFEIKGRPHGKPIPILGRDKRMLEDVVEFNDRASFLAEKFWPGPLTLILKGKGNLSELITAGSGKAAVRVSASYFVARLFNLIDEPLTSTSANLSGSDNLLEPDDIYQTFNGKVELIVDSGNIPPSKGSTVVDVTTIPPVIVRLGDIDRDDLKEFFHAGS
ncbi:MAG: L-threonylcarbamoyladenylate synthase [Thermodesulfobacteriota bacterium]